MNEMRCYVAERYSSNSWKEKVERMSENQVTALWYKFQKQPKKTEKADDAKKAHQLSFSDFGL